MASFWPFLGPLNRLKKPTFHHKMATYLEVGGESREKVGDLFGRFFRALSNGVLKIIQLFAQPELFSKQAGDI